jgi:dipeptidyl-peptidase-4
MNENEPIIPIEQIAQLPLPGLAIPGALAFSPDDRWITYLYSPGGNLTRQLFCYDLQTGKHSLLLTAEEGDKQLIEPSLEQMLRAERQRRLEVGITQYAWSVSEDRILFPLQDGLYIKEGVEGTIRKIAGSDETEIIDPQFSPNGEYVAFVQENELYVVSSDGGEACQVTQGARGTDITHGLAEFIAQEEMGRSRGFWWSPDSQWLAYEEVDETHIPVYRIMHLGKDVTGESAQEDHHYPFTGQANARVRLGVVSVNGGETTWMDLGSDPDIYLARVDWLPDGRLSAQIENRQQTELELVCFNPQNGERHNLWIESNPVWINLHDMFRPLEQGGYIWASERSGFRHLYLYNDQGTLIRQLTSGDWVVDTICDVDESGQSVYFTGCQENPLDTHLYAVSLEGGDIRRITLEAGTHSVVIDHAHQHFIDIFDTLDQPPLISLRSLRDGRTVQSIFEPNDPRIAQLHLQPPELVSIQNKDGVTLYGAIYRPTQNCGRAPYPTIVSVYGGPHVQMVKNHWQMTVALRAQHLRSQGFLVFMLDNRGSDRRGQAFEGAIKGQLGNVEVQDQIDGVNWLVEQGLADPLRVGIYGWSYGGYMAAMCLAKAPEIFKAAVAGAPVTHMDGYDTHYTERYMSTPQANPTGYTESNVLHHAAGIKGRLMLVHGLIDENVHFRNTARLVNALIRARIPYDLLLFPEERHMPRRLEDRVYMEQQIVDFFIRNL